MTALVDCKLIAPQTRDHLLAGINPEYVSSLPLRNNMLDQIRSDLVEMNSVSMLGNQEVPLSVWLTNAVHRLKIRARVLSRRCSKKFWTKSLRKAKPEKRLARDRRRGCRCFFLLCLTILWRVRTYSRLEAILLAEKGRYVGLVGMAGSGKMCAGERACSRRPAVQRSFPGGIYWIARPDINPSVISYQKRWPPQIAAPI